MNTKCVIEEWARWSDGMGGTFSAGKISRTTLPGRTPILGRYMLELIESSLWFPSQKVVAGMSKELLELNPSCLLTTEVIPMARELLELKYRKLPYEPENGPLP